MNYKRINLNYQNKAMCVPCRIEEGNFLLDDTVEQIFSKSRYNTLTSQCELPGTQHGKYRTRAVNNE